MSMPWWEDGTAGRQPRAGHCATASCFTGETSLGRQLPGRLDRRVLATRSNRTIDCARVRVALTPEEQARLTSIQRADPEAYDAYVRGRHYAAQINPEGFEKRS